MEKVSYWRGEREGNREKENSRHWQMLDSHSGIVYRIKPETRSLLSILIQHSWFLVIPTLGSNGWEFGAETY
jgi:hypothetical protein